MDPEASAESTSKGDQGSEVPDRIFVIVDSISNELWGPNGWVEVFPEVKACWWSSREGAEEALSLIPHRFGAEIRCFVLKGPGGQSS